MRLLDSEKVYKYIKETPLIPNHAKGAVYLDIEASSTYIVDAVERDCFDRVLRENDIMRQQLAEVGKKPGDAMSDVCKVDVVEAEYVGKDEYWGEWLRCSACGADNLDCSNYCSKCGRKLLWV